MKQKRMNLCQKYILPKSQMAINSLLANRDTQNHQLNFSHEDFSIQIKQNHFLSINFYEPDLQDIQWNIQFLGIKSLNHVTVSQYKRKRIRLLYAKNNILHFYEGHLISKQNKYTLRDSLLQSQKIIPLRDLQNDDEVLFISQDLAPFQKAGLYLIVTKNNHFYILKGNVDLHQLIDLNQKDSFNKFLFSITHMFTQKSQKFVGKNEQETFSYLSLRKSTQKQEFFKIIVLRNFLAQTRLISLPTVPGQKCQRQIILTNAIDFQLKIKKILQISPDDSINILRSQMHRLSEVQVGILLILQKSQKITDDCYHIVSVVYNFQKGSIISINDLPIPNIQVKEIEIQRIPQTSQLLIKVQFSDRVVLNHVQLETLQFIQTLSYKVQSPTLFCESTISERIFLLSPYKVLDIKVNQSVFGNGSQMQEQQIKGVEQKKIESLGLVSQLHKNLAESVQKLQGFYRQNKSNEIIKILDNLLFQVDTVIKDITSTNKQNISVQQIFSIYLKLLIYKLLIKTHKDIFIKDKRKMHTQFKDLITKQHHQIRKVLQSFEKQKHVFGDFTQLWISVIDDSKNKSWFQNDQIRKYLSQFINSEFSELINSSLQHYFSSLQDVQNTQQPIFFQDINENLLLEFVKSTSGIIRIERQNYRLLINKVQKKLQIKNIALDIVNIDLLVILYFQFGLISSKQLENTFKMIPHKKETLIQGFIQKFLTEFISRLKDHEKIQINSKNLCNLISIFADNEKILKKVISQSDSNLFVLTNLMYGERQAIKKNIIRVIETLSKQENQQKLRLIENHLQQNKNQKMDEE